MRKYTLGLTLFSFIAVICIAISYYMFARIVSGARVSRETLQEIMRKAEPELAAYNQESVTFLSDDNLTLHGTILRKKERHNNGLVILCHGFKRTKESMLRYLSLFADYDLFLFDFRSCGNSEGACSSIGAHEYKDVIGAVRYVRRRSLAEHNKLIIFGVSMGASAAIRAAARTEKLCDALILDSPYACLYEVITHVFSTVSGLPFYPFFPLMYKLFSWQVGSSAVRMRPIEDIIGISMPVLLIHSSTDQFTLPDHSVKLYGVIAQSNKAARLWVGPPAKHTSLFTQYPHAYKNKIYRFLRRIFS